MRIFKEILVLALSCAMLTILHNGGIMLTKTEFALGILNSPIVSGAIPFIYFIYFSLMLFIVLNLGMMAISFLAYVPWVIRTYGAYALVFLATRAWTICQTNGVMLSILIPYVFFMLLSITVTWVRKNPRDTIYKHE